MNRKGLRKEVGVLGKQGWDGCCWVGEKVRGWSAGMFKSPLFEAGLRVGRHI